MGIRKYFPSKREAIEAAAQRSARGLAVEVFRMRKGTKHHGEYYVGTYMEYINFAN